MLRRRVISREANRNDHSRLVTFIVHQPSKDYVHDRPHRPACPETMQDRRLGWKRALSFLVRGSKRLRTRVARFSMPQTQCAMAGTAAV